MPIITKMLPTRETGEEVVQGQDSNTRKEEKEGKDSGYEDFEEYGDDECVDSDMEGSILHRPRPKKKQILPPAVPQRSDKRTSKILENVMLELKTLDGSTPKELDQQSIVSDPLEFYLSSEEDASFSDDYEDSLVEFDTTGDCHERAASSSRSSQEDTARVVSFTLCKPQIINIYIPPAAAQKRHSMTLDLEASSRPPLTHNPQSSYIASKPILRTRPSPLKLYPSSFRRMSIGSITSSNSSRPSSSNAQPQPMNRDSLPPRKSSKFTANLANLVVSTKASLQNLQSSHSHSFLNSDPFATTPESPEGEDDGEDSATPKTPTSMAAAAWRRSFNRTLSKARKPSIPKINLAYTHGAGTPRNASKLNLATGSEPELSAQHLDDEKKTGEEEEPRMVQRSATMTADVQVRYEDIMKNVIRAPPPQQVASPKNRRSGGLVGNMIGLGRMKSLKGR